VLVFTKIIRNIVHSHISIETYFSRALSELLKPRAQFEASRTVVLSVHIKGRSQGQNFIISSGDYAWVKVQLYNEYREPKPRMSDRFLKAEQSQSTDSGLHQDEQTWGLLASKTPYKKPAPLSSNGSWFNKDVDWLCLKRHY
jgi:hypothetical protein